jgi:flagellar hook-length control protein FliK
VPSMPSRVSDVAASLLRGSAQRLHASATEPTSNAQPFAALLDASASASDAASAPVVRPQGSSTRPTTGNSDTPAHSSASDANAAGSTNAPPSHPQDSPDNGPRAATTASGGEAANASSAQNGVPGEATCPHVVGGKRLESDQTNDASSAATNSSPVPTDLDPVASAVAAASAVTVAIAVPSATTAPAATSPAPANQDCNNLASASASAAASAAAAATAANDSAPPPAGAAEMRSADAAKTGALEAALSAPEPKTSSSIGTKDEGDKRPDPASAGGDSADAGTAATAIGQAQAAASPSQPIAAAIPANGVLNTATATASGPASAMPIDQPSRGRAKVAIQVGSDQEPRLDAADGPPTKPTSSVNNTAGASQSQLHSGPPDDTGAAPASSSNPQLAPADNDATLPAAADPSFATNGDRAVARPGPLAALSSPDGAGLPHDQAATAPAATATSALPNFGFAAANSPSSTAMAATPAAPGAPAAAVPVAGLAVAIAARAQAGSHQFDIRLDPPELGRIDVRLDIDRNGQATTHVTVDRTDTLQLLQSQQPQLERALEQAGLKTADNGLQFTLRDHSFAGQNGSGGGSGSGQQNTARLVIPDPRLTPVDATQIYSRLRLSNGVDIRV